MCPHHTAWQMKNITDEECGYLYSTACPFLSPPLNALFLSFTCLFPEAAIFIHTLVPLWLEAGLGSRFLCLMCVCVCVCAHAHSTVCVCLRRRQHSVYFQSILFKDQTRGWWLIFLSPAFFHLLGKRRRGGEKKRRGLPSTQPRNNLHIPSTPVLYTVDAPRTPYPPPCRPSEVQPHPWGVHPEKDSSPWSGLDL